MDITKLDTGCAHCRNTIALIEPMVHAGCAPCRDRVETWLKA